MMIAQVSSAAQREMSLGGIDGGTYHVGRHMASWKTRPDSPNIVDLRFRRRSFTITKESRGQGGRARLFVNGFRQPDGKLLQGRELLELIRKIDRFYGKLIKVQLDRIETGMHVRFDRIEKAISRSKWPRLAGKGKLCTAPIAATWTQERYVPKFALGGFSRVPLPVIQASHEMASGEYRLLQAILFCAQGTGLLTAGKIRLARLASVGEQHVKDFLRSLCNRQIIRPTGRTLKFGVREHELLTHPWLMSPEIEGGQNTTKGGQETTEGGPTLGPLKTNNKTAPDKTSKKTAVPSTRSDQAPDEIDKDTRSYCGEKLLGLLGAIVRPSEIVRNEPMWRARIKTSRKAIMKAIKEYYGLSDEKRKQIQNPAAWMTKRYRLFGGRSVAKTA